MANKYELPYTGAEVEQRLNKIDNLVGKDELSNMVTCDLNGATEDTSTVPLNADTLGGNSPEYYAKSNSIARRISERINIEEIHSSVLAVRDGNIVSYYVNVNWYDTGKTFSMTSYQMRDLAQLDKAFWPYLPIHNVPGVDANGVSSRPNIRVAVLADGTVQLRNLSSTTVSNIQGIYTAFTFAARYTFEELEEVTT